MNPTESTGAQLGTCDFKQYEHCGPHRRIPETGGMLPPFGCKNWKPVAALKPSEGGTEPPAEKQELEAQSTNALLDALEFYADPLTYHAIGFFPDRPCGLFMEDFSETEFGLKPGKFARAVLAAAQPAGSTRQAPPASTVPEGLEQQPGFEKWWMDLQNEDSPLMDELDEMSIPQRAILAMFCKKAWRAALAESEGRVAKAREDALGQVLELVVAETIEHEKGVDESDQEYTDLYCARLLHDLEGKVRALRLTAPGRKGEL